MGKPENLIGQKFNRLTPIEYLGTSKWKCKCDCGNETIVLASHLKNNSIKSCGCYSKEYKLLHLEGQRFGKLTVLYRCQNKKNYWHCKCDCGNEKDIYQGSLVSNKTLSCGCYSAQKTSDRNLIDLTGKRFGRWLVLYRVTNKNENTMWHCKCDCGTERDVNSRSLLDGHSKSCGCLRSEIIAQLKFNDLTNKKFGKLTVLYPLEQRHCRHIYWHCKCDCGNETDICMTSLISGNTKSCGCLTVNHSHSSIELEIKNHIEQISGKQFKKVKILDGKEIDLYNDDLKLGIEYNGSIFHATINGMYDNKLKNYHQQKFLCAKEKGIHLINIFDVEYANNKDKILAYISDIINPKYKIYARQCDIQKIDTYIAWEFYDKYHLQKHNNFTQINYGLYYNNELIAVMGFGKLRMKNANKENNYELHRYCVKHGYKIIGGSQKLFKHFIEEYNPQYIKSYSDNNYFLGSMYEKLGFVYKGQASISYFWVLNNKKLKREQCQVKKLKELYLDIYNKAIEENVSNKEDYIMTQLGACKVYTAGNSIWEYNKEI